LARAKKRSAKRPPVTAAPAATTIVQSRIYSHLDVAEARLGAANLVEQEIVTLRASKAESFSVEAVERMLRLLATRIRSR